MQFTQHVLVLLALSACSAGAPESNAPESAPARESATAPALLFEYGKHHPHGQAAVDYLLSEDGMWREMTSIEYVWNYYSRCARPNRPYDRNALIAAADGTRLYTAPDANCNLLLDANHDGELDVATGGYAFHEHNGRGVQGQQISAPFTNFWFDDNLLARFLTRAYGHTPPDGLSAGTASRWQILDGTLSGQALYLDQHFDTLALDGLQYLARGDLPQATHNWTQIRDRSGYMYDATSRRYEYPLIDENYHLGLFQILTAALMDHPATTDEQRVEFLQHWVALRSQILDRQEIDGSRRLGWRSSVGDLGSLMNTETISINVLALGSGALEVYEAGHAPLQFESNGYALDSRHFISATAGVATQGYITLGPFEGYAPGAYSAEFILRATAQNDAFARLEVADSISARMVGSRNITQADLAPQNFWSKLVLKFEVTSERNALSFQTYWHGQGEMDVAVIRIRRSSIAD